MKHALRLAVMFALSLLASSAGTAAPIPKGAGRPDSEYYPLVKGTKWVYKIGNQKATVEVVGTERFGKEECVRLETEAAPGTKTSELFAVRTDGIYRVKIGANTIEQPVKVLPFPVKEGSKWTLESKVGMGEVAIKGAMTVKSLREKVKTPAGEFEAVLIESSDLEVGGAKMQLRFWFARGYGIVRQEMVLGEGNTTILELVKFTVAGAASPASRPQP